MVVITKLCNKCGRVKEHYEKFTFNGNQYDICAECAYHIKDAYKKINEFFIGVSANKDVPVDMTPERIKSWTSSTDSIRYSEPEIIEARKNTEDTAPIVKKNVVNERAKEAAKLIIDAKESKYYRILKIGSKPDRRFKFMMFDGNLLYVRHDDINDIIKGHCFSRPGFLDTLDEYGCIVISKFNTKITIEYDVRYIVFDYKKLLEVAGIEDRPQIDIPAIEDKKPAVKQIGYNHELVKEYIHTEDWVDKIYSGHKGGKTSSINAFIKREGIANFVDFAYYTKPEELADMIGCPEKTLVSWYYNHGFKSTSGKGPHKDNVNTYFRYDQPIAALN